MSKIEAEICKECRGSCCRSTGCSLSPEDMLRRIREQKGTTGTEMTQHGNIEEDIRTKAPAAEAELTMEEIESWLMNSDCALDSFGYPGGRLLYVRMRPKGGRMLIASEDHRCTQKYTREMMVEDWMPYQERLKQIWKKWYERFTQDGTFDRCEEEYMKLQRARREQMMASLQE